MPLFSRFKNKGAQPTSKGKHLGENGAGALAAPRQPKWQARWESTVIVPDEVKELVHVCTLEMKSRAEALDAPFFLLPFRPDSDPQGARTFIRNYYKSNAERSSQYKGEALKQELRLTDSVVLCSIMKWCWSRMPGGVVSWPVYDGFRMGEKESKLARNAFDTFIPIGVDSEARKSIIFDFFDLMAAVAAHGKMNGLTGRKLSRLAGWWAFDHSDDGKGFEGGYKSWTAAADASSHLFFAYLRSLSPDTNPSMNVIERIPRSLQALVASTEYPPETPTLLQRTTPRVVMLVDTVSSTPFALLRRAKNFEYRDKDRVLRELAEYEDPVDALTEECKRVLYAVATANQSNVARSRQGIAKPDESWSAFQSLGFADLDERALSQKSPNSMNGSTKTVGNGLREQPRSRNADTNRPTTPSWADFLSSGFSDDDTVKSPTLLYPPAQILPQFGSRSSSPGHLAGDDENLAPGELAAITTVELDDAFWWVWITSLAGEEPSDRKAVFGRCALVETSIQNGRWLIMEEQVKGANPDPAEGVYIAPKKSLFSFTKRGRLGRKRSTNKHSSQDQPERVLSATPSKTSISTDQHAKIRAAARALTRQQDTTEPDSARRGRNEEGQSTKTNSMLTLGLQSEAGPAMKWASSYDKHAVRQQYLGDSFAGKGMSRENLASNTSSVNLNDGAKSVITPAASPKPAATSTFPVERDLPAVPKEAAPVGAPEPVVHTPAPAQQVTAPEPIPVEPVAPTLDPEQLQQEPAPAPAPTPSRESEAPTQPTALDKELAVEKPSPASVKVGRKPVPRQDDHPAFRKQSVDSPKKQPSSPTQTAAAMAAVKAMQAKGSTSPELKPKKQVPQSQPGGFKKLFGKKKEGGGRGDSVELPRPGSNGLAPPAEQGLARRLSLMRKKQSNAPAQKPNAASVAAQTAFANQEPVMTADHGAYDHSPVDGSRSSTHEREAAEREFARFDQGPVEDMPATMPESEPEPSPEPPQRQFNTETAKRLHPEVDSGAEVLPFDAPVSEDESEIEDHHDAGVVQDRWATIRENAHKRAARHREEAPERASEDHSTQRTDDGETSGEETIESRVARIKARVAELTGNIETNR
ncbi:hypothetical protein M409DRAFT_25390 [Zasmidium cellare ATCC 36951]|uniref:Meiotically up-regulated protein Msb1/Mug8 domain-containing protein n=1 Tax=Zasmidium cellare ATCC 36951 TaxID=1080233 RepID=A0A6A6CCN6_ZASCE|nr:uncharacterized protein M409DRAFT_25390 [Zasmidium cellare ATCC 36951]KAF2164513.1 hypothetical protein M409DRAFT_25390 [Zasmidium cellare ATCC 36951]